MPRHKHTDAHLPTMGGDSNVDINLTDAFLGNLINSKMTERGIDTYKQLEIETVKQFGDGVTHSHLRRMVRGHVVASDHKLQLLSTVLKVPLDDLKQARDLDRIRREYGATFHKLTKRTPEFQKFEAVLPFLTTDQLEMLYGQMKLMATQNATHTTKRAKRS